MTERAEELRELVLKLDRYCNDFKKLMYQRLSFEYFEKVYGLEDKKSVKKMLDDMVRGSCNLSDEWVLCLPDKIVSVDDERYEQLLLAHKERIYDKKREFGI